MTKTWKDPAGAPMPTDKVKSKRGFASMTPERRTEIARKGGAAVDPSKRSFSTNRDLAATAGAKGGATSHGGGRKPASDD